MKSYLELFRLHGALPIVIAGMLGRFPVAMSPLAIILVIADRQGSFLEAGVVSAGFTLAGAVVGPQLARLADSRGQRSVLLAVWPLHAAGMAGLIVAIVAGLALGWLITFAIVAGAMLPNLGVYTRARWAALTDSPSVRHSALSWETTSDEASYVIGPALVGLITVAWDPIACLGVGLLLTTAGIAILVTQRSTEPRQVIAATAPPVGISPLRTPGFVLLLAAFLATGGIFGSINVTLIAAATDLGAEAAGGLLVSLFSLGSLIAGLVYGAVPVATSPLRRWLIAAGSFAACTVPLLFLNQSLPGLVVAVALAGCVIAPTMIAGHSIVAAIVASDRRTEGFSWLSAFAALGITLGSTLSGQFIDDGQIAGGFWVLVGSATTAFVLALIAAVPLSRTPAADRVR